eukprot:1193335-Prorocentrum_minimum.AAC.4
MNTAPLASTMCVSSAARSLCVGGHLSVHPRPWLHQTTSRAFQRKHEASNHALGELTAVDCFFVIAPVVSVHSPFHPLLQEHRRSAADLPAVCMGDYISR